MERALFSVALSASQAPLLPALRVLQDGPCVRMVVCMHLKLLEIL